MSNYIIGISCYFHDSAASLIKNGEIISAVQEERFSRIKNDSSFPKKSIEYCLNSEKIDLRDIDAIVYYEKPLLTFERLLETYIAVAPKGAFSFVNAMRVWIKDKIFVKRNIRNNLKNLQFDLIGNKKFTMPKLLFSEHHLSHAASAFFPSPFKDSAILCMDGVGEWATTSAWIGKDSKLQSLWKINFPHSIGLLYSAFTFYCGFKVNSGEYKLMGLAPYGKPNFKSFIKDNLIDIKPDGSFRLNLIYFDYHHDFQMTNEKFNVLFGKGPRKPGSKITQHYMDMAASIQFVIEEVIYKLACTIKKETGMKNLCLAGGVALNCVANGKILEKKIFEKIWVQPASGDSGAAIGAGLQGWYQYFKNQRIIHKEDSMKGCFLGPKYNNSEIRKYLNSVNAIYKTYSDEILFEILAEKLDKGFVIGWFSGALEFGPRSLGSRSIIADPRDEKMQSNLNLKIKKRESFRPFAPAILEKDYKNYFELEVASPYMLFVVKIKEIFHSNIKNLSDRLSLNQKIKLKMSKFPAITHFDFSSRVQTVNKNNFRFYNLISAFKKRTGCPIIINTSFNVRGEPIVCDPKDAFNCFMKTDMDILVLENQILFKSDQPKK